MRRMSAACQETVKDDQPVTNEVPQEPEITIIRSYREHSGSLLRANLEPQAAPPRRYLMHQPIVAVHFIIGVIDKRKMELWNCRMRPLYAGNGANFLDINDGRYKIESTLEPATGITDIISRDWKGDALPPYFAEIDFVLPAPVSMQYHLTLRLFSLEGENRQELSSVYLKVITFPEGGCLDDIQEGPGLEIVERPLQKTKPKGILARTGGWKIIMYFQKLVDNGKQARFRADKEKVSLFVKHFPAFLDLLPCVMQEDNFYYDDEMLVELTQNALNEARKYHSPNEIFFHFRTKCTKAISWAKRGRFLEASKQLEQASEICNEMAAGQFKAILCYAWAQHFSEKIASQGHLSEQEWEDAERYFNGAIQYHTSDELMMEVGNGRLLLQTLIRQLTFYLKSSRRDIPNFDLEISDTELRKAKDVLVTIRRTFVGSYSISKKHRALLFMFETDLHIRHQDYYKALMSSAKGLLLAQELNRYNWIAGMIGRMSHVLQQNEMVTVIVEQLSQWGAEINDNPGGVGPRTDLVSIDQLLKNLI